MSLPLCEKNDARYKALYRTNKVDDQSFRILFDRFVFNNYLKGF